MKQDKLLGILNNFNASDNSCKKVYCTTCGGLAHAIKSNITPEINNEIKAILVGLSVNEFASLGDWCDYLKNNYQVSVYSIYERESKNIDASNIQQLDYYLFHSRKLMYNSPIYKALLTQGIQAAIDTSNSSLIETLAIILGDKILKYDKLFQMALDKSKSNKQIHRVLYNTLREKSAQVRNYVGDGTSWW